MSDLQSTVPSASSDGSTLSSPLPMSVDIGLMRRRVFDLAWPVIGENFLQTMLGIVDTLLVAQLGTAAIAGVGAALQLMFFVIAVLSAVSVGSAVLVAQAIGGRDHQRASVLARQSLFWSVIICIPLAAAGLFAAEQLIGIFGMEPDVTGIGADYLRVVMGTVVMLSLMLLSSGVLRGAGDSRTPMLITLIANMINVVLTYGLIFGRWGMPELGVVGSAWGTFLSRTVGFILLFIVLWRGQRGISTRGRNGWLPDWSVARGILRIGVPAAVEQVLVTTGFFLMTLVVAHLGTVALAAHRIAMNAMSLSFLPGFGFGLAATTLVGQSIGARRPDEGAAAGAIATQWGLVWMSALGVIFFFAAEPIIRLFSDDSAVIGMGTSALRTIALVQPFWAISFIQAGALRGTGNTQYPLRVNTSGIWVAVLLGGLFSYFIPNSLSAVWSAFILTAPITAYLHWRKFRRSTAQSPLLKSAHVLEAS
ncbi:MAG: MATE family efflux transporter [Caldilineaceae bacterium]|nr:MATE family efflux transporter [Caldilineaceae bacterium]